MSGAFVVRGDAGRLPLADASVDLIITSPPYFALRSYRDGGEHYNGQVGSEPTPQAFLEALWSVMAECWRVLKPEGSCFVNLGDKRSGSGGHNNATLTGPSAKSTLSGSKRNRSGTDGAPMATLATRRNAPDRYNQAAFGRPKSKMLLPHRFAIGCEDGLADPEGKGWIVRSDLVWSKLNGLPESVTDRCRDSHEYIFHMVKQERYFAAVDEVRETYSPASVERFNGPSYTSRVPQTEREGSRAAGWHGFPIQGHPLGKLPGSVWPMASEPLVVPEAAKAFHDLPDHFAAFPSELPRRIILGWSPSGICVACGTGRRPVVVKERIQMRNPAVDTRRKRTVVAGGEYNGHAETTATITGHACACPEPTAPTRPAVVLDPFSGTATVAGVARTLGRIGIGVDLSWDYCRLGAWFLRDRHRFTKAESRTHKERQGDLFAGLGQPVVNVVAL